MRTLWGEEKVVELLQSALALWSDEEGHKINMDVKTYAEAGLLTYNRGIVLRVEDTEFQIQVVQSK